MYNNAIGFHKCIFVALNQQFAGAALYDNSMHEQFPAKQI